MSTANECMYAKHKGKTTKLWFVGLRCLPSSHSKTFFYRQKLANTLTAEANPERNISGMQAFWLLLMDAFGEICGNLMVIFLIAFLSMKPPGTFASPFYLMATLFLPFQLTAFFSVKEIGCKHVLDRMQDVEETKTRDFPVGVVFHAIVTGCYFFMESQMAGRERDVLAIQKLRNDLKEAQARGLVDKDGNKKSK